jgi:hypothetical protein
MNTAHKTLTIYEKMFCMKTRNVYQLLSSQDIVICNKIRSYIANNDTIQYVYNNIYYFYDTNDILKDTYEIELNIGTHTKYWNIEINNIPKCIDQIEECCMLGIGCDISINNLKMIIFLDLIELFKIMIQYCEESVMTKLIYNCYDNDTSIILKYIQYKYTNKYLRQILNLDFNQFIIEKHDLISPVSINFLCDIGYKCNTYSVIQYIELSHTQYSDDDSYQDVLKIISILLRSTL